MTTFPGRVVGGLLAGGESRRMGQDKAALLVPGAATDGPVETFAARALRALAAVADEVVVLGHGRGVDPALPRLADALAGAGPAGGLLALLESGRGDTYVVTPVDMPFVDGPLLAELLAGLEHAGLAPASDQNPLAVTFAVDGRREPLPLALRAAALPAFAAAVNAGERRLGRILDHLGASAVPCQQPILLQNINDFDELRTISGERRSR